MHLQSLARIIGGTTLSVAILFAATAVSAQTWEYKSYKRSLGGQYNKDNFVTGSIKLEEKDGKATVQINAGAMDACRRAELPAQVSRTDTEITIEPEVPMSGCEKWRVVIRTDGSGGPAQKRRSQRSTAPPRVGSAGNATRVPGARPRNASLKNAPMKLPSATPTSTSDG